MSRFDGYIELGQMANLEDVQSGSKTDYQGTSREYELNDVVEVPKPRAFTAVRSFHSKHVVEAWRLMLSGGAVAGIIVLLVNLITLIVVYAKYQVVDHAVTLFTGSCTTTSNTIIGLHLAINVLSSILLATSNSSMQCLSSPTRTDVDRAHAKTRWLTIGTPSVRNIFYVSRVKAALWILLGLSSFPLHLLWNSVFFETLATNEYIAVSATDGFLQGKPWSFEGLDDLGLTNVSPAVNSIQASVNQSKFTRMENADCIRAYGQQYQVF